MIIIIIVIIIIQWNPAVRTPVYYRQFRLPRRKAHWLIQTTGTFLCPESQTFIYRQAHFTESAYLRSAYFPWHNHKLILNIVVSWNNDRFQ